MFRNSIIQFNENLVSNGKQMDIVEYIKTINNVFYNYDISDEFIDEFIGLVDKNDFVIHHQMLYKYGVLKDHNTTNHILRLLVNQRYKYIEGIHFIRKENSRYQPDRGADENQIKRTDFLLQPDTFKKILMRCENTDKYADYYILLEKAIKWYQNYQNLILKSKIKTVCENRVLDEPNKNKQQRLVVIKMDESSLPEYYVIRGQVRHIKKALRHLKKTNDDIIVNIDTPYAVNLYNVVKTDLKDHLVFEDGPSDNITNYIGLADLSEEEFVNKVHEINETKFNI